MSQTQLNAANQLGGSVSVRRADFTATQGQTSFDISPDSFAGAPMLHVFVGGALLKLTDDYALSGSNIVVLNTGVDAGVIVSLVWFAPSFNLGSNATSISGYSADQLIQAAAQRAMQVALAGGR